MDGTDTVTRPVAGCADAHGRGWPGVVVRSALLFLLTVGCPVPCVLADGELVLPLPSDQSLGEFGWLEVQPRQVRAPDDQTLVVRGKIRNPYDQPIDGVRLIVRLSTAGHEPRELVILEREIDVQIEAGEEAAFNRELATSYSKVFAKISIAAFAVRRGTQTLSVPPPAVVADASKAKLVAYYNANLPSVNSLMGNPGVFNLPR